MGQDNAGRYFFNKRSSSQKEPEFSFEEAVQTVELMQLRLRQPIDLPTFKDLGLVWLHKVKLGRSKLWTKEGWVFDPVSGQVERDPDYRQTTAAIRFMLHKDNYQEA